MTMPTLNLFDPLPVAATIPSAGKIATGKVKNSPVARTLDCSPEQGIADEIRQSHQNGNAEGLFPDEHDMGRNLMRVLGCPRYEPALALAAVRFARFVSSIGKGETIEEEPPAGSNSRASVNWHKVARVANGILRGVESDRPQLTEARFEAITTADITRYFKTLESGETWVGIETREAEGERDARKEEVNL